MANATYTYRLDTDEWEDRIRQLRGFAYRATGPLYAILEAQFALTQAQVHIITGSLKLSGSTDADFDGKVWTGTITYGGPSTGPHNPVHYAIYEMKRGGAHDFFTGLNEFHERYMDAIVAAVKERT